MLLTLLPTMFCRWQEVWLIATSSGLVMCELIRFSTSESITLAQYLKKYGETEEVRKAIIVLKNILLGKRIHCKDYHAEISRWNVA